MVRCFLPYCHSLLHFGTSLSLDPCGSFSFALPRWIQVFPSRRGCSLGRVSFASVGSFVFSSRCFVSHCRLLNGFPLCFSLRGSLMDTFFLSPSECGLRVLFSFVLLHGFVSLYVGVCFSCSHFWTLFFGRPGPLHCFVFPVFYILCFSHEASAGSFLSLRSPFGFSLFLFPVVLSSMVSSSWVLPSLVAILSFLLFSRCGSAPSSLFSFGLFLSFSFLVLPSFLVFCGVFFPSSIVCCVPGCCFCWVCTPKGRCTTVWSTTPLAVGRRPSSSLSRLWGCQA